MIFADSVHKNCHFYGQQASLQRVAGNLVGGVQIVPGTEATENMTTSLDIVKSNLRIQK